jgi:hypothetical protein
MLPVRLGLLRHWRRLLQPITSKLPSLKEKGFNMFWQYWLSHFVEQSTNPIGATCEPHALLGFMDTQFCKSCCVFCSLFMVFGLLISSLLSLLPGMMCFVVMNRMRLLLRLSVATLLSLISGSAVLLAAVPVHSSHQRASASIDTPPCLIWRQ